MNKGLIEHFEKLTDPRVDRTKRYPLIEIIFMAALEDDFRETIIRQVI